MATYSGTVPIVAEIWLLLPQRGNVEARVWCIVPEYTIRNFSCKLGGYPAPAWRVLGDTILYMHLRPFILKLSKFIYYYFAPGISNRKLLASLPSKENYEMGSNRPGFSCFPGRQGNQ